MHTLWNSNSKMCTTRFVCRKICALLFERIMLNYAQCSTVFNGIFKRSIDYKYYFQKESQCC